MAKRKSSRIIAKRNQPSARKALKAKPESSKPKSSKPKAPARPAQKSPTHKLTKGKWVYSFGGGRAEGKSSMKNLLGGKGSGLAEMANLGLPVPPGFTITTEVCTAYYAGAKTYPKDLERQVAAALAEIGRITGRTFGDQTN